MNIDFADLSNELVGKKGFKRLKTPSVLGFYYSFADFCPSFAILSNEYPLLLDSTKYIKVSQWKEDNKYWTKLQLSLTSATDSFYILCNDMINCTISAENENSALKSLRNRYSTWKKLFNKSYDQLSAEVYLGLYGELYTIYKLLAPKYGFSTAIRMWSGANKTIKDFSVGNKWIEVKTSSISSQEITISSAGQLKGDNGKLCNIRVEKMSNEFDNGESSVADLVERILSSIDDFDLRDLLLDKITDYGYSLGEKDEKRYKVHDIVIYDISSAFPRITETPEGVGHIKYTLIIDSIKEFITVI